jgi:aspartate kinase
MEVSLMKVAKFGGSSLASAAQIRKVYNIVLSDPERQIVVVSAPGKRSKDDIKVTDMLIACAESYLDKGSADNEVDMIVSRYEDIAKELGCHGEIIDLIASDIKNRLNTAVGNRAKFIDLLKAAGEDNCARLVAAYFNATGVEAYYVNPKDAGLLLSNQFGNAQVLPQSYENLKDLRNMPGIKIFPGFFGYSLEGDVVTFSRGGSDITGSILAAAVEADLYENFTDVDSIYAVDPNIIENPHSIRELTYREMRELSYSGFGIFHEEALIPVYRKGIPVRVLNTNNPDAQGTTILLSRSKENGPVVGIASGTGFCSIYISKYLMNREIGFGRKLLQILEEEGLSYEHTPSGIDNISVILKECQFSKAIEERVIKHIKDQLSVDDIAVSRNQALIMVVGEGMQRTVGIAARITGALAKAGVNIEMINQGSSEVSMMFGVKEEDNVTAVKAIYEEFFGK